MFNANTLNNISNSRNAHDKSGTMLEEEFLGSVNKSKYDEEAYAALHKNEISETASPEVRFNEMLKMKEKAHKEFESYLAIIDRNNYINFQNSMALVERCQPGDPERPTHFFSKALYNYLRTRFDQIYTLKFFTAVGGTHLDVLHKVDFFFKLYLKETGEEQISATGDITARKSKDRATADVLLNINPEEIDKYDRSKDNKEFDEVFFNQKIQEYGEEIVAAILRNWNNKK